MIKKKYCESTSLKCEGLVFDLDGTLLNTLKGHAQSFNRALETLKMPRHPIDSYRYFIGNGAQMCARRSLPSDSHHLIEECVNLFKDDYACSWYETTVPYLGIQELLKECSELNIKFSVLSNKDDIFTQEMITKSFPNINFDYVAGFGHREIVEHKPHPSGPKLIANELDIDINKLAMVGDTPTDIETARENCMTAIGVSWGFRSRTELYEAGALAVVNSPEELLSLIKC
ncbi:MAG: HAD family hydrolase [Candidatus Azotimanducaceae bacterium]|uniref:phosphoglycolate phosphatase n=1 Tax=OM182 bacterium TaxID=2510334 RepID=A0A520S0D1_9GAMM|nr:HAD family hydrolase [Gammaproteobacteria bacterium]OUV67836.1 MAG: hypothetical protein CBC93_03705 [Gammaproteobacteria bacterium TMED133]RZO75936.1 MAG: HAD family hydrolase [OM182 bacterium]